MSRLHSLRWRLILFIVLGMSAILGMGGWIAYRAIANELYAEFDRSLKARAAAVISMVETEMGFVDFEWMDSGAKHPPGHEEGKEVFQIWASGDRVLGRTPLLGKVDLPRHAQEVDQPVFDAMPVPNEQPWRGISWKFIAAQDLEEDMDEEEIAENIAKGYVRLETPAVMDIVIARIDTVHPALAAMRRLFLWLWMLSSVLAAAIVWLIVRQNMRPLDSLRKQISALKENEPNTEITLVNPPVELTPVVDELNHLLSRVGEALRRERSLTSNIAHELRTPIAGLLSTLEVTLNRERSAAEYREAGDDCLEIAKRMHWLVNNLLSIARVDAGNVELHDHIVPLKISFQEWWQPFAEAAAAKDLQIAWRIEESARLETDPEFLRVVVSNLFDNAVSYTATGGSIVIEASNERITVGNDAVDLKPEMMERVFEPFWRNQESREEGGAHAGLGLSLCQKIVRILGGEIDVALLDPGNHFQVKLQFSRG